MKGLLMFHWDDDPDLNITPLVDVMLVLMAILMITAPTINYQEQIDLPQGTRSKPATKHTTLTIEIDKKKNVFFKGEKYTLASFPDTFMLKAKKFDPQSDVFIRADKDLDYGSVMRLLRSVKAVGFTRASLITE
jgi:biopolymer transport protein ExbD